MKLTWTDNVQGVSKTSSANARVKLHSQVHFDLCCIRKQFGLKLNIQFFCLITKVGSKKLWSKNIWVKRNLCPKIFWIHINFGSENFQVSDLTPPVLIPYVLNQPVLVWPVLTWPFCGPKILWTENIMDPNFFGT